MTSTDSNEDWLRFCNINERRRAVRDFDGAPLDDADVRALSSAVAEELGLQDARQPPARPRTAPAASGG